MATKKIELIFDLDAKDVQFATDKTLSLTQQIRVLKQELAKGNLGQKEFEIVAAKVGDLEDSIAKAGRRSADFATTLQLIPGPVGEIASKVNGAIALLKQFSGFSFKDLQFQFKETANDIKEIFSNLGSFGERTKEVDDVQKDLNDTLSQSSSINASAGQAILQNANKNQESINVLQKKISIENDYQTALKQEISLLDESILQNGKNSAEGKAATQQRKIYNDELVASQQYSKRFNSELETLTNTQNKNTTAAQKDAVAQGEVAGASAAATVSTKTQTTATNALTIAQNAASNAGRILKGVLASLGIGLIIIAVTSLATKLYELVTSTKEADKANEDFGETLQQLNRILEDNLSLVDEEIQIQTLRAQIAGKSEKELNDITLSGIDKRIAAYKKGRQDLERQAETLDRLGLSKEQTAARAKEIGDEYVKLGAKILDEQQKRRIQEVRGEKAVADETKKIRDKNAADGEKVREEQLQKRKADLDALIQLEINKKNTDEKILKDLLAKRLELEKLTGAQLLLAQQENQTKLRDALKDDYDKDLQLRLKSIDAIIEKEQSASDVDIERVKKLLLHKRDLELQNTELLLEERQAIYARYDKQIRDIDNKQREDKLIADIAANQGNYDALIELYRQYAEEALNSEKYTEQERVKIIEDANSKIRELQDKRFEASLTAAQLEYGEKFAYDADYYNKVRNLYDTEEQNYKDLLAQKKISQAEFDAFMKDSADARISLDKAELDAKMANFEAVSAIFSASASLVGEQTKAGKALSIASATIDTYVSANKVLADPTPMPTFLRFALAAGAIIRGLASVKKIVDTKLPTPGGATTDAGSQGTKPQGTINVNAKMAQGGMVTGPGSGTSDSIPAMLSNGEYVVNARSTRLFQPLLAAINDYGLNTPAFAAGGLAVQQQVAPRMDNTERIAEAISLGISNQPIRTYVTSSDVTNQQQFDRVIKSRSLI